jgi:hypothetical protein
MRPTCSDIGTADAVCDCGSQLQAKAVPAANEFRLKNSQRVDFVSLSVFQDVAVLQDLVGLGL